MGFTEEMLQPNFNIPKCKINNLSEIPNYTKDKTITIDLELKDEEHSLNRVQIWINNVPIYGSNGYSVKSKKTKDYIKGSNCRSN